MRAAVTGRKRGNVVVRRTSGQLEPAPSVAGEESKEASS